MNLQKAGLIFSGLIMMLNASCMDKDAVPPEGYPPQDPEISVTTIVSGYEIIWGMDFLPGGDLIFGEKRGRLYRLSNGTVKEITGFPAVFPSGQGGLLDIRIHPDYDTNGWIYASYSGSLSGGSGQLNLIRFKIINDQVSNIGNLFSSGGINTWYGHYGSRILFDRNNYLYLSIGEGGPTSLGGPNSPNLNAQNTKSNWGKIHRFRDDGSIPDDNPVLPGNTAPSSIWSYGHRNPQGLALHPETGEVWSSEHGPMGGDELNIIKKGLNYGWPLYSIGINYDGTGISSGHTAEGIEAPLYTWTPSIGVCGIAFITNDRFAAWKGNLLASGLALQKLYRCVVKDNKVTEQTELLTGYGRVRNVIQGPDGDIYVSVEGSGRILRISPLP
jgi:glucose/arabinose dehydrogenase